MPDDLHAVHDLVRRTIANEVTLYDPSDKPIGPDHPAFPEGRRKTVASLHNALDKCLAGLTKERLSSPEEIAKALRECFERREAKYVFDPATGVLTTPDIVLSDNFVVTGK